MVVLLIFFFGFCFVVMRDVACNRKSRWRHVVRLSRDFLRSCLFGGYCFGEWWILPRMSLRGLGLFQLLLTPYFLVLSTNFRPFFVWVRLRGTTTWDASGRRPGMAAAGCCGVVLVGVVCWRLRQDGRVIVAVCNRLIICELQINKMVYVTFFLYYQAGEFFLLRRLFTVAVVDEIDGNEILACPSHFVMAVFKWFIGELAMLWGHNWMI